VTQAAEAAEAAEAVEAVAYLPRGPDHRRTTGAAPIVAKRRCPSP